MTRHFPGGAPISAWGLYRKRTRENGEPSRWSAGLHHMPAATHFNLHLREHWEELKHGRPGHRFQDRYKRARRDEARTGIGKRVAMIVVGVVVLLLGGFFAIVPGPAIPFFLLGGALLATESRVIARAMDWSEVRVRKVFTWGKRRWKRLPIAARVACAISAACVSAGSAYGMYRLLYD